MSRGKKQRSAKEIMEEVEVEGEKEGERATTRNVGQFPLEEYCDFLDFLMGREGGKKSERNARGIVTHVAKFHFFVIPTGWMRHSLHAKKVLHFVCPLKEREIGGEIGTTRKRRKRID